MQVLIQFTTLGSNSVLGSFGPGDRMRCSAEQARHFVEEAKCAKYVQAPVDATPEQQAPADEKPPQPARKTRTRKEA